MKSINNKLNKEINSKYIVKMPKKQKAGKNKKSAGANFEKRKMVEADLDGQVYGIVEKALGDRFFTVNCLDNLPRRCKVRQKRMKVIVGDCVIVSLRDYDDSNADIIYKYEPYEVRQLQKDGILPDSEVIGVFNDEKETVAEDDTFVFEDI
jgi:translation initiation factor 1A